MMLLAMLSPIELGLLLLVGYVGYRIVNRVGGIRPASGFLLKTLGVVAVVAGIGVLATRSNRSHLEDTIVNVDLGDHGLGDHGLGDIDLGDHGIELPEGFDRGDFLRGEIFDRDHDGDHGRVHVVPSGLIIVLGSGLIILGAMLFGRERTRPFALKALSFLGVGAILFSVISYFGEPPRAEPTVRMVHAERQYGDDHRPARDEQRIARRPTRPTRAKRPSLRPDRPSSTSSSHEESIEDFLPPRAGEIPVAAELAKAEIQPAAAKPADPEPVTDVKVEVEEVKVAEVKVAEAIVEGEKPEEAKPEDATPAEATPAEPAATEATAAEKTPATEEPKPAEPEQEEVAETKPAAEAAAAPPAEVAKPAAPEPPAAEPAPAPPSAPQPAPEPQPAAETQQAAETQPAPATHETAVAAAPKIISSQPRPAWVDRAPGLSDGVYAVVVSSGPYVSIPECQRALNDEILAATNHYINEYLGDDHAAALVNLPVSFTRQNLKKTEYAEVVESPSVGRMHQLHARLEFDDHARNLFQQRWRNAVVQDRLWYTGGGAALVLALLATFYGYLKLDLKTDAPHKGRLQLAATLVALIVAAGALLARWAVQF